MEKEIDIYEFNWWNAFVGFSIVLIISVIILSIWYYEIGKVSEMSNHPWRLFKPNSYYDYFGLLFPGLMGLAFSLFGFLSIRTVPKLIIFKENNIKVIFPSDKEKVFSYSDIRRIVIIDLATKPRALKSKSWSPFKVRLYFSNHSSKITFDPNRVLNFPALLQTFRNKGLGPAIEQK